MKRKKNDFWKQGSVFTGLLAGLLVLLACLSLAFQWVHIYQSGPSLGSLKRRSFERTKDLFVLVCRDVDGYLHFFMTSEDQDPGTIHKRLEDDISKFQDARQKIIFLLSLSSPQDKKILSRLRDVISAGLEHTDFFSQISEHVSKYNELENTTQSLDGQATYFRTMEKDEELAKFLDKKTRDMKEQGVSENERMSSLAGELNHLTEKLSLEVTELYRYLPYFELDENDVFSMTRSKI